MLRVLRLERVATDQSGVLPTLRDIEFGAGKHAHIHTHHTHTHTHTNTCKCTSHTEHSLTHSLVPSFAIPDDLQSSGSRHSGRLWLVCRHSPFHNIHCQTNLPQEIYLLTPPSRALPSPNSPMERTRMNRVTSDILECTPRLGPQSLAHAHTKKTPSIITDKK